jgi:hypothetical protein
LSLKTTISASGVAPQNISMIAKKGQEIKKMFRIDAIIFGIFEA